MRYHARKPLRSWVVVLLLITWTAHAGDDDWILGRWELTFDPDGADRDWLEFLPDGDVFNISQDGERVAGIYLVTAHSVKAVFTRNDRDVIMTFHFDDGRETLRIVTSRTGRASVYEKIR